MSMGSILMLAKGLDIKLANETSHWHDTRLPKEEESSDRELLELSVRRFGLTRR